MHSLQRPGLIAILLFTVVLGFAIGNAQAARERPVVNPPPSLDELDNATYFGITREPITLSDGHWEGKPYQPEAASRPVVGRLKSLILHGDLNGDRHPESVAVLWRNDGGSGSQLYIAIFARQGDKIVNLDTADIGSRVQIRAGHIEGRGIVLDVIQAGPDDPACCPSQKVRRSWMLVSEGGQTVIKEMPARLVGRLSLTDLSNIDWQLRESPAEEIETRQTAEKPITLHVENGQLSGYSGCNRYQATITAGKEPSFIAISAVLSTRMACAEKAMNRERYYLQQLTDVDRFMFSGGDLLLSARHEKDSGKTETLIFQKKP